jgi:hypothetical protein
MSSDRELPDFPAPPRQWISLQEVLARPSRLLPGDPETREHPLDDAIRKEVFQAAMAGQIRYEFLIGQHLHSLTRLPRDPIDGRVLLAPEHWDLVDRVRGVLEHPAGVSRGINICTEDAQAHIRAWLRQQQLPSSQDLAVSEASKPVEGSGAEVPAKSKKRSTTRQKAVAHSHPIWPTAAAEYERIDRLPKTHRIKAGLRTKVDLRDHMRKFLASYGIVDASTLWRWTEEKSPKGMPDK